MGIPGGRRDLMLAPYANAGAILSWRDRLELPLRLPSESEWEHACRGGAKTRYFWGEAMDRSYCWFALNSRGRLHSVLDHLHKTNAFGLIDPLGQVWELCQDEAYRRWLRGGAIDSPAHEVTCANRRPAPRRPDRHFIGVRWCADIPAATDHE